MSVGILLNKPVSERQAWTWRPQGAMGFSVQRDGRAYDRIKQYF